MWAHVLYIWSPHACFVSRPSHCPYFDYPSNILQKDTTYEAPQCEIFIFLLLLSNIFFSTLFPNTESEEQMLNVYKVKTADVLQLLFFLIFIKGPLHAQFFTQF
jgi:hypothetical protein